jgi:hypothetical protein
MVMTMTAAHDTVTPENTKEDLKAAFFKRVQAEGVGADPQATTVSPEDAAQYPTAAGLLADEETD